MTDLKTKAIAALISLTLTVLTITPAWAAEPARSTVMIRYSMMEDADFPKESENTQSSRFRTLGRVLYVRGPFKRLVRLGRDTPHR